MNFRKAIAIMSKQNRNYFPQKWEVLPASDTLQVKDYSKYDMTSFDEGHKKAVHDKRFSVDLNHAFTMGAKLSQI